MSAAEFEPGSFRSQADSLTSRPSFNLLHFQISLESSVSQSGPYRPPGGVEEMQRGGRRVRLECGAYITA
ncbi:hypothetical protein FHG87_000742 [Trinorchestia longiramus]|nr:hypothetical protein FHG87_000742 [Trinorchestia longiramus]